MPVHSKAGLDFIEESHTYRVSQILSRSDETGFKAIIIMFNSLGYSGVDEDLIMLQNLLTLSSKNGCILITLKREIGG
ncbi:MAG TPA: hypothetical protein VKA91_08230 [Nitrososphaeraceae archaeon]|nr:hypothetical protein [Nitrososphaeraceae archaeon]